jgi:hypothetical protein
MAVPVSKWITVFDNFSQHLRINSKEVSDSDDGLIDLRLWESQRRFLVEIATGLDLGIRHFYCLKSRQLGVTTLSLALVDVFWASMHPNIKGCLVTENEKNRDANRAIIIQYVKSAHEFFGDEFTVVRANQKFILFSNGARIDLLVAGTKAKTSTSWAEGAGYTMGHLTEVAAYGDSAGLASLEESFAQENPNRLYVYESTAKGFGLWRDKWMSGFDDPLTKRSFFLGWWSGDTNRIEKNDPRFRQFGGYLPSGEEREKVQAVKALYNWTISPEQLAWIRWKEANATTETDMLGQNQPWTHEDAFVQSGYSFFQTRIIGQQIKHMLDQPEGYEYLAYRYECGGSFFDLKLEEIEDESEQGMIQLKVWEEPAEGAKYVIGMDTAYGRNQHKDATAIQVFRCFADKVVQVAEFCTADMDVQHSAWVLAHLAGAYRDCLVNIEVNGPGGNIMIEWANLRGQFASEMYADKVRSKDWQDALGQARWYLWHKPDTMGAGYAYNTMAMGKTVESIMHGLRSAFVVGDMIIRSRRLFEEMNIVVVDEAGHIGARESKSTSAKDDRVFASAYAIRAWVDWIRPGMIAEGLSYERVTTREKGEATLASELANHIVHNFLRTQAERAQAEGHRPTWRTERGL